MTGPASRAVPLWPLPLVCALLFLLAIHASFLLSASAGHVPWCLPYGIDCVSISSTGRQLPAKLVFKPLLTVAATGLLLYWWLMRQWLRELAVSGRRPVWMMGLGMTGAACLILYTAVLGEGGETALVLRRTGAVLGFSLSYIAQLLLVATLRQPGQALPVAAALVKALWWLVVGMLALGMVSALSSGFAVHDRIDDAIEWWLAMGLNVVTGMTAGLWKGAGFGLELQAQPWHRVPRNKKPGQ